jgi:hypothetical protein
MLHLVKQPGVIAALYDKMEVMSADASLVAAGLPYETSLIRARQLKQHDPWEPFDSSNVSQLEEACCPEFGG